MSDKAWETYEQVATDLFDRIKEELGLQRVEGKQTIPGHRSGTDWTIDAKGVSHDGEGFVIIECRRYTTLKQNQEKIASLAYRITDTGAGGGIIVSPLGLQAGAEKVAAAENILEVALDPDSTPQEFAMRFLNRLVIGVKNTMAVRDQMHAAVRRKCSECGEVFAVEANEHTCLNCASQDKPGKPY